MSTKKEDDEWREWLETLPENEKVVAARLGPEVRIKSTSQKAHFRSIGTTDGGEVELTVVVLPRDNPTSIHTVMLPEGHTVFGLTENDLEPWTGPPSNSSN